MEKRYQVFISSTFQDLENARQEVSQALLRADCFPAGMELFPAADEEQFEFIKAVIDQSDYYIIISAGRYGSIHPGTGLSYTEMEYDYAMGTGKPVIRLLHKDPFVELKGRGIEKTDEGRKKLTDFRERMSRTRLVRYWEQPSELGSLVDHSLRHVVKTKPAVGWVQSNAADEVLQLENYKLKERIREFERRTKEKPLGSKLQINLPISFACLNRADLQGRPPKLGQLWIPLEEAFMNAEAPHEREIAVHFFENERIGEDDAVALIDALVLDGVLSPIGGCLKLTKFGRDTLRKFRVGMYLDK